MSSVSSRVSGGQSGAFRSFDAFVRRSIYNRPALALTAVFAIVGVIAPPVVAVFMDPPSTPTEADYERIMRSRSDSAFLPKWMTAPKNNADR